ncbi:MAG: molybdate transport system regulatory protein [Pseudohongiellaceae bacterium]|jgi:molybdate transport system regulatory protein
MKKNKAVLKSDFSLPTADNLSFSEKQIILLQAIDLCGSISAAAKDIGISYKTAWDRVESMNNQSSQALVKRSAGGVKGGGTTLTKLGQNIVSGFKKIKQEHQLFLDNLSTDVTSVSDFENFSRENRMKSSARNQFGGIVEKVTRGAVNTEVELKLGDSLTIVATITNDSQRNLKLKKYDSATALIKSSWILLSTDVSIATSARNNIVGQVLRLKKGEVNSEVVMDIGNEKTLCAIITNTSAERLDVKKNQTLLALFKASSVILLTD